MSCFDCKEEKETKHFRYVELCEDCIESIIDESVQDLLKEDHVFLINNGEYQGPYTDFKIVFCKTDEGDIIFIVHNDYPKEYVVDYCRQLGFLHYQTTREQTLFRFLA